MKRTKLFLISGRELLLDISKKEFKKKYESSGDKMILKGVKCTTVDGSTYSREMKIELNKSCIEFIEFEKPFSI